MQASQTEKDKIRADYPLELRPSCLRCRKRMQIHGHRSKYPYWNCRYCKNSNASVRRTHAERKPKRTRTTPQGESRAALAYPLDARPCCAKCKKRMALVGHGGKWPSWLCKTCRHGCVIHKIAPVSKVRPKRSRPQLSLEERKRRAIALTMMMPRCIKHHSRMYQNSPGSEWRCYGCERKPTVAEKREQRLLMLYPLNTRPFCMKCKARMTVHTPSKQAPCFACSPCHLVTRMRYSTDQATHKFLDVGARPCCVKCKRELQVAGTPAARRWQCGTCGFTVLAVGTGYKDRRAQRTATVSAEVPTIDSSGKAGALAAITADAPANGYVEGLRVLGEMVHALIVNYRGQSFNGNLHTLRKQIAFQLKRTPASDRKAVVAQINAGCSEPEEIAEAVPLSIEEIHAICVELVNTSDAYEWRPIGKKPEHGQSRYGIFRKDAPAVVRPIFTPTQRADLYAVDRRGLREVVTERRAAQG